MLRTTSIFLAVACALAISSAAASQTPTVRGVRALETSPLVPRGGVMMMKLTADRQGAGWPDALTLTLSDGTPIEGIVAWVVPGDVPRERAWTDDPRGLAVKPNAAMDPLAAPTGVPYLLARMPLHAQGEMKLDRQSIRPVWLEQPAPSFEAYAPTLERVQARDLPDVDSPFEFWRWVVLAEMRGMRPPEPPQANEAEALLAEYIASLWRIGLGRLEQVDAKLARQVRQILTRTATDRGDLFASWVADPGATGTLLTELLRANLADQLLAQYVQIWLEENDKPIVWPEADYDATLRLAVLHPGGSGRDEMTLRFPGAAQSPMRFSIEPNALMRVLASKPVLTSEPVPTVYGRQPVQGESVVLNMPGREMELPLRPRRYAAVPPGVFLSELGAPLTLAEVQTLTRIPVRSDEATLVSIRKLRGRWEVFVDCRRPASSASQDGAAQPAQLPERLSSFDVLCGAEAITVIVGPERIEDGASAIVTVPEKGWPRVYAGVNDGSLQVHTQSHGDRWHARIVLPEDWLPHPELGPALLGFVRTHGNSRAIELGPNASVPWRLEPGRVAIDLSEWDGEAAP